MTKVNKALHSFGAFLVLNFFWWLASLWINQNMLPSPVEVYKHLFQIDPSKMSLHVYNSFIRLFWGILIAVVIGFLVGLLMGRSEKWNKLLDPIVYLTYPIPKIALLPIIMLLFGLGNQSKIILIVLIVVFPVILSVRDGVKAIPESYYKHLTVLGASSWQKFKVITLPAGLSSILSALRVALGTAIAILFFTEVYGTEYGLGYFVMDAWGRLDYLDMYSGILVLSAVAFILFLLIDVLENRLLKWRQYV
ncbi:ABC transporter permease [Vagococcus fluvialis]|jgi:NitT/TauT family transport system permease protein|uniref:ABC transporter permease n=1 Tax=Vagococcus fluvialis TaxID=2738 RepID=A0A7X6I2Y4_9ENTE|nr:ABC transporter permease [Vagococcus fluvialis]MDR2994337.1 ABC transporter permease [Bacillus cereus]MDT2781936.1 ABC transporter permease [Vagococcus fluvialis]NKC67946.1 ABC transporter permease [Vagococcus fluvialis]UDM71073.1 ABC transporter permease [Vagococcus fluvialis]UDM75932.1 ABC transporter permease [Vagococcus fluvialis]